MEAATVGMPFEVWKTHMGTYRNETTMEAFRNIYRTGGVKAFWTGLQPKLVESFLKGGILLFSKEAIIRSALKGGMSETGAGLVGGFGGGIAQVTIMGPCTFLVTAAVTGDKSVSVLQRAQSTWRAQGIKGFYHGGTALMFRQGVCASTDLFCFTHHAPFSLNRHQLGLTSGIHRRGAQLAEAPPRV